jgi:radical SAM protein with 4Fe4S-binding SPASM domain
MLEDFGDIRTTPLREALEMPGFRDRWSVTKDSVGVCRDCEFRYICTDCRAYTDGGDPLGKPAKCTYDPYTATWG